MSDLARRRDLAGAANRPILVLAWALVLGSGIGCSSVYFSRYREGVSQNQQALLQLELGMPASEARAIMGEGEVVRYKRIHLVDPWRSEAFELVDGTKVEIFYYLTQPPKKYYAPQDEALTPLVFENDVLAGWGWSYLRRNTDRYQVESPRLQE